MSVFGFMLKKRGLRRTKSNDFEKNNPYQNHDTGNKAMSTANLPSFAWERTTQAPADLAIAAQNEQSKLLNNNRATESQLKMNRASNVGQGSTQTLTPLLRDVDDGNVRTTVAPDPHRHAQSAGENVIAYITYNDPGFTSNHCLSSTGLVPLQIERQPSPPSPLVSKHGSLHSITTCTATSSGPNSSTTDSRPSTRSASTSQKIMTSSLPPPLPPSICIQPHTPVVESHDEPQHHKEPENKEAKEESPKLVPSTLPSPPITPSSFYSSPSSSSCSVNTTAAAPPTPPTTTSASMASNTSHLPPSLRPGNRGNRSTLALPVPMAAYLGSSNDSSSTASKRQSMPGSTVRAGSTRRRTLSNPLHIQLHLNPLQQIAPAPATATAVVHNRHSRSHSTGRDSTSSNGSHGSGASSSSSSSSASSTNNNNRQSNNGGIHNARTAKHHKRLSTFDAHRLSEQVAAREWAQARARSRSASRSSVNLVAGAGRYYAGGGNSAGASASTTSLVLAQAENGETGASGSGGGNERAGSASANANVHLTVERRGEGDKSEGEGDGEEKRRRRRTISGDWLRGRNRDRSVSKAARNMVLFCP
ncbi:hypothetical protein BC567DRAFT_236019 [Phyllosticta citribraziliensis]